VILWAAIGVVVVAWLVYRWFVPTASQRAMILLAESVETSGKKTYEPDPKPAPKKKGKRSK